ncbi:MAG: phosphatase PAP2 family protein [Desulfobacterales bacterium]|nr:phosphatase PAP2 family protein [Desulfobacterales bacterium]
MESLLDQGIPVILWLQQFSPGLDGLFAAITFLGNMEFFLIFLPLVYWCIDRRVGARLSVIFLFSAYVNFAAKWMVDLPRPFQFDPRVRAIVHAAGNGFPSGHTQGAVVLWGFLAAVYRRRWLWILAAVLMVAIPLSRLYLGVHFPLDLMGGYLIGGAILGLYLWVEPRAISWLESLPFSGRLGFAVFTPLMLVLVFSGAGKGVVTTGAAFAGMAGGFVLERRWVGFSVQGSMGQRALRLLSGLIVLGLLWAGLKVVFAGLEPALLFRFVRYALVGLWAGFGAPWLFVRLKLATPEYGLGDG